MSAGAKFLTRSDTKPRLFTGISLSSRFCISGGLGSS